MDRYGRLGKEKNSYLISAFLLAQIGRKYALREEKRITGAELMDCAESEEVQRKIGSGVVYLDSVDNEHLSHFYGDICGYRKFSGRVSESNNKNIFSPEVPLLRKSCRPAPAIGNGGLFALRISSEYAESESQQGCRDFPGTHPGPGDGEERDIFQPSHAF